ncbi:MAG TPA: zinc-ribbon domain-containing protein [Blastocatellia bacterium]|nr:zinc-ribbon domain-containing protein [Blastocatellia bacterium]
MYCPKCGTHNQEDVKFCRACGANLSLVPQALSGSLPAPPQPDFDNLLDRIGPAGLTHGIRNAFIGAGFLIVAIVLLLSRQSWGIWMLIPAFALLGKGVAGIVAARLAQNSPPVPEQVMPPPARNMGELPPPSSVTESTTRHLDPVEERHRNRR